MVGGVVIEVAEIPAPGETTRVFVDCRETGPGKDTCAIYVEANGTSRRIQIGDLVWWQAEWAMWTPMKNRMSEQDLKEHGLVQGVDYDVRIPKIGSSGAKLRNRPKGADGEVRKP